ncbi:MAG: glycoside hydrolase family 18 protein [Bacteroidota bacterium]
MKSYHFLFLCCSLLGFSCSNNSKTKRAEQPSEKDFAVIAYYSGNGQNLEQYRWDKMTHVIYSFCHLEGQKLAVDDAKDSLTIRNLVALKEEHPQLKVLLSLGGWGGCKTCSAVFAEEEGRQVFAQSVKDLMKEYNADGLDLDWEYPGIEGYPGHQYLAEDKANFTDLVKKLRQTMGEEAVLSFAAGGFQKYFDHSIEWEKVMPVVDYVNLMSYDLVGGYSKVTGHHTSLFSTKEQARSGDQGIQALLELGVPAKKIVIGAAFYARTWENVENINQGLYQSGTFKSFVPHRIFEQRINKENGFVFYRDSIAQAPYAYSAQLQEFATFDDPVSIRKKTEYAMEEGLGGIMFWQLTNDQEDGELLRAIWEKVDND